MKGLDLNKCGRTHRKSKSEAATLKRFNLNNRGSTHGRCKKRGCNPERV